MVRPPTSQVLAVRKVIARLPRDSKRHVEAVAAALWEIVAEDGDSQEVELALTLVLAQLLARARPKH